MAKREKLRDLSTIDYSFYFCTDEKVIPLTEILNTVENAIKSGITIVQLRLKQVSDSDFLMIARRVRELTKNYNIPLIINDNVKIAQLVGADGVHIGQNDLEIESVREIINSSMIIGVSVTTFEEASKAVEKGADYIGVGAIFPSRTKPDARVVGIEELVKITSSISVPIVIIGGINAKTIPLFKSLNVNGYAMIRAIVENGSVHKNCKKLSKLILKNKKSLM